MPLPESLEAHKKKAAAVLVAVLTSLFAMLSPDARRIVLEAIGAAPAAITSDVAPVGSSDSGAVDSESVQ